MSDYLRQSTFQVPLPEFVRMAETGQLRPAPFSRPQIWGQDQVANLFDSIVRDYPIGTIFVVRRRADEEEFLLGNVRINAPRNDDAEMIVDGLQRITAIVNVLSTQRSQYDDSRYDLFFDPENDELVSEDSVQSSLLPLRVAASRGSLTEWLDERPFLSESQIDACWRLAERLSGYLIAMTSLEEGDAAAVFTRLNTSGTSLTRSELARARSSQIDEGRSGIKLLQFESERLGFGVMSSELAAECAIATLRPGSEFATGPTPRGAARAKFQRLPSLLRERSVDHARRAIGTTIQFLSLEASIPHVRLLPQRSVLATLVRLISLHGAPTGRPQELLRRWVWRSGTMPADEFSALELGEAHDDLLSEATALLDWLPSAPGLAWRPDPGELSLDHANGRLNTLGLLSARPSLLVPTDDQAELAEVIASTDVPISSARILISWLDEFESLFCELLPPNATRGRRPSLGSRLLHPPASGEELWNYVLSERRGSPDKLVTHQIDDYARDLLRVGDFDQFVEYREGLMIRTIGRYVQSRALWGFRDHGSLPHIADSASEDENPDEFQENR